MKKRALIVCILLALLGVFLYLMTPSYRMPWYHELRFTPQKYQVELSEQQSQQTIFQTQWKAARTATDAKKIESKISPALCSSVDEMIPFWLGTDYDFYGTSTTPGKGKIACGYFVTIILRDLGLKLDRSRLAQLPSEDMIKELVEPAAIIRQSNHTSIEQLRAALRQQGDGLYCIGLDTHTGLIRVKANDIRFIHASGRYPWCVISESIFKSKTLRKSQYKVFARIDNSQKIIDNYLGNS